MSIKVRADQPVLKVRGLNVKYQTQEGLINAVNDVSFDVYENEVFGIAGESGCGKSTLIRSLMRLLSDNGQISAKEISFQSEDLLQMSQSDFREKILWVKMSLVPQSAMNSLNPVYRIGDQIIEVIQAHTKLSWKQAKERVVELFDIVGLQADLMQHYPHEFSGGMRQRAMIAMSMALNPNLIIMDEPTTGLDVLVQERILRKIREIREHVSSAIILITHDIAVIAEMSNRIAIMYNGTFMEESATDELFKNPYHPYTLGLKNAFPSIRTLGQELISIPGSPPTFIDNQPRCPFVERCPFRLDSCKENLPPIDLVSQFHKVRCFRHSEAEKLRKQAKDKKTWHF